MKVLKLVQGMHRKYAGDTKYPTPGTDNWTMYLAIINTLKDTWATDPDLNSDSCFEEREVDTVTATDLVYALDDDVCKLSDKVYVDTLSGRTIPFTVIKARDRHNYNNTEAVFLSGDNPRELNFTYMPTDAIGGTIRAGIYFVPPDVSDGNNEVPVDRPMWVMYSGAAELAFNDPSKEDKFADLNGLANDEWQKMIDAAATLPAGNLDQIPTVGHETIGGLG